MKSTGRTGITRQPGAERFLMSEFHTARIRTAMYLVGCPEVGEFSVQVGSYMNEEQGSFTPLGFLICLESAG
jgi:hypothetical protein